MSSKQSSSLVARRFVANAAKEEEEEKESTSKKRETAKKKGKGVMQSVSQKKRGRARTRMTTLFVWLGFREGRGGESVVA